MHKAMNIKEILQSTAQILMPRTCPVCGKALDGGERYICRRCLMDMPRTMYEAVPLNNMAQRFVGAVPVERASAYFFYERNAPYSQILQDIKYRNVPDMGRWLARRYAESTADSGLWDGIDYLIPVPLHIGKLAKRGYNQALYIALGISDATQIPVYEAINAVKGHATQTHKSAFERRQNTKGLYASIPEADETLAGKHVMCESPIAMTKAACEELFNLADGRQLVLLDSLRTAYSTAYARMLLLVKSGRIGKVVSIDATCTSLESDVGFEQNPELCWGGMNAWGPTAMLPIFQILGDSYEDVSIVTRSASAKTRRDDFTEIVFRYQSALATVKVGTGVKSEGSLVVAGTEGYIYVPAPWWKTEYFEIRYENPADNRRYFYQLDGEGIRYEWVTFLKMIDCVGKGQDTVDVVNREGKIARNTTLATCGVIERFLSGDRVIHLQR